MFNTISFCGAGLCIFAHTFGQFLGNWTLFSSPNTFPLHQLPMAVVLPALQVSVQPQHMLGRCWCSKPACSYIGGWSAVCGILSTLCGRPADPVSPAQDTGWGPLQMDLCSLESHQSSGSYPEFAC